MSDKTFYILNETSSDARRQTYYYGHTVLFIKHVKAKKLFFTKSCPSNRKGKKKSLRKK